MKKCTLNIEGWFKKVQPSPWQAAFFTRGLGRGKACRSAILSLEAKFHKHGDDGVGVKKVSLTILLTSNEGCWYISSLKMKLGKESMQKECAYPPAVGDSGLMPWQLTSVLHRLLSQPSLNSCSWNGPLPLSLSRILDILNHLWNTEILQGKELYAAQSMTNVCVSHRLCYQR